MSAVKRRSFTVTFAYDIEVTVSIPAAYGDQMYYRLANFAGAFATVGLAEFVTWDEFGDVAKANAEALDGGAWANQKGPAGAGWPSLRSVGLARLRTRPAPAAR